MVLSVGPGHPFQLLGQSKAVNGTLIGLHDNFVLMNVVESTGDVGTKGIALIDWKSNDGGVAILESRPEVCHRLAKCQFSLVTDERNQFVMSVCKIFGLHVLRIAYYCALGGPPRNIPHAFFDSCPIDHVGEAFSNLRTRAPCTVTCRFLVVQTASAARYPVPWIFLRRQWVFLHIRDCGMQRADLGREQ